VTLTRELIGRLPKAELHVHLDGSLRPETMVELARTAKVELPTRDPVALRKHMLVDDVATLEDYLARFDLTIPLLQDPEAIERVAYEMVEDAARDNLRYLEVRYCPLLSTRQGLSLDEVVQAEWRGLQRGKKDFGVPSRIINCSLRHYLAGGEAGRPPGIHGEAFDIAVRGLLHVTVHAGEAAGPESIAEAIHRCHAERIGHGTRLHEDPDLQAYVRDRELLIETNVTSNLQTRAVARASEHPVRRYFDAGLAVTLCTDSWLMSGVSLTDEYWLAHRELGFTREEIDEMILNACAGSFLPQPEREALWNQVWLELEAIP